MATGILTKLEIRADYADVYTPEAQASLRALAALNPERRELMDARMRRRRARAENAEPISFLHPASMISRTSIRVADARAGGFRGSANPADLERQWIQGTGPATKPRSSVESGIRNVAYALLSGADGWSRQCHSTTSAT